MTNLKHDKMPRLLRLEHLLFCSTTWTQNVAFHDNLVAKF